MPGLLFFSQSHPTLVTISSGNPFIPAPNPMTSHNTTFPLHFAAAPNDLASAQRLITQGVDALGLRYTRSGWTDRRAAVCLRSYQITACRDSRRQRHYLTAPMYGVIIRSMLQDSDTLDLKDLAASSGVSVRTIRFYQQQGLLAAPGQRGTAQKIRRRAPARSGIPPPASAPRLSVALPHGGRGLRTPVAAGQREKAFRAGYGQGQA